MPRRSSLSALALAVLVLAGCGGSGTSGSTSTPAPTPTPTPLGPPSESITLTGDPTFTVPISSPSILCEDPGGNGLVIDVSGPLGVLGQAPFLRVTVSQGLINVKVAAGAAASYSERDFTGTGTSGFDAARGVHLSGALTESTAAGTNKGSLGAVTAISGSIDCGNQTSGTTTVIITGSVDGSTLSATPKPVKVTCDAATGGLLYVTITGPVAVGSSQTVVGITAGANVLSIVIASHFYTVRGQVSTSVTSTGAHMDQDVTEASTGHTLHLRGDATCGAHIASGS